jgi:hypothetical protein
MYQTQTKKAIVPGDFNIILVRQKEEGWLPLLSVPAYSLHVVNDSNVIIKGDHTLWFTKPGEEACRQFLKQLPPGDRRHRGCTHPALTHHASMHHAFMHHAFTHRV